MLGARRSGDAARGHLPLLAPALAAAARSCSCSASRRSASCSCSAARPPDARGRDLPPGRAAVRPPGRRGARARAAGAVASVARRLGVLERPAGSGGCAADGRAPRPARGQRLLVGEVVGVGSSCSACRCSRSLSARSASRRPWACLVPRRSSTGTSGVVRRRRPKRSGTRSSSPARDAHRNHRRWPRRASAIAPPAAAGSTSG